jgi:hypothetical protein
MEALQNLAFEALAAVFTRVVVSTMKVQPHGLVNMVFIQFEEDTPKEQSAGLLHRVLAAYPLKASVVATSTKITDSVLTHLRSMTVGREYKLANMKGFRKRQLAQEWRLRYSAINNLKTAIASRGGLGELEQIIADIDNSNKKQGFMEQFGGNKYHAIKLYSEILKEEGLKMKEQLRAELTDLDLWSPSHSFSVEADSTPNIALKCKQIQSDSESIGSAATSSNVIMTDDLDNFVSSHFDEQGFDDLFNN